MHCIQNKIANQATNPH